MNRSAAPHVGLFADRYELGALLGRGGMAEVFEGAAHGAHGFVRRVAIKRLLADVVRDDFLVRMFLDEARIASHLHHAGIVAVLDYGVVDNVPFQVLELVEGWDTAKLYRMAQARGLHVPVEIAMLFATEVAHALAYAHDRRDEKGNALGIVHRDVKPSNILVSKSGDVKLGDFGIAFAKERSAVTTKFAARGTPGYMSPEQLFGGALGPPSDVFAVGLTLHGLLTGATPLKGDGQRLLLAGMELPLSPDLPLDVRAIIQRAIRVNPLERYASARELAQALGEVLAPRMETDPKSLVTEWLGKLEAPPPPSATTTAVMVPMKATGQFTSRPPSPPVPFQPPRLPPFSPPPMTYAATAPSVGHHAPPRTSQPLRTPPPPRPPTSKANASKRGGGILAFAALVPLGLLAGVLIILFVFRPLVWSPTPEIVESKDVPVATGPPGIADAAVLAPVPELADAPAPRIVDAGPSRAKPMEGRGIIVSSVVLEHSTLDPLDASPAALKALVASVSAAVRRCAAGKAARRGGVIETHTTLSPDGRLREARTGMSCLGQWCKNIDAFPPWAPQEALDCVRGALPAIPFPPLKPGYTNGADIDLYFQLQ